jgi:uncharacterized membrane protein
MVDALLQLLSGIPPLLTVLVLSVAPVVELRAAIPVGIGVYDLPVAQVFLIAVAGNMIPAFILLYGWDWFVDLAAKHWPWLGRIMSRWYQKTQVQWDAKIEKYGPWALILFVAVPLPGSGVWSGALAAWIFQLEKTKALLSLLAGVIISALIVTILTVSGIEIFKTT